MSDRARDLAAADARARFRLFETLDPAGHRVVWDLLGFGDPEHGDPSVDVEAGRLHAYDRLVEACVVLRAVMRDGDGSIRTRMTYDRLLWLARDLARQLQERGEA